MRNLLFIICLLLTIYSQSQSSSKPGWSIDLDLLKEELPKHHVNFFHKKSNGEFLAGIKEIPLKKDKLSDLGIAIKLQQLIAGFGDAHTTISWDHFIDSKRILPLQLLWFKDGIYITHTIKEHQKILGHKIVKINGRPIDTVVDSLSTLLTVDNKSIIKRRIPGLITTIQLLEHFGIVKDDVVELHLEDQQGEPLLYEIRPALMDRKNRISIQPDSQALCYRNERAYFSDYYVQADKVYYLQYNQCWSREYPNPLFSGDLSKLPSFKEFQDRVLKTIRDSALDKVVFDLRFNTGGNSIQGKEFIRSLSAMNKVNKRGKLYVVLGRATFSSAVLHALDFKNMTQAIFVGEETSGKPSHYGDIRFFILPSSGLKVYYSTKFFKHGDEDLPTITPDHIIETSFKDYKEGKDPVYEWIKKQ